MTTSHLCTRPPPKGRAAYAMELMRVVSERPHLAEVMTVLLYETLGPTLGAGNENAASVFGIAHNFARRYPESLRRAGFSGEGPELGNALFDAIFNESIGVVVSVDPYEETWRRIHDRKINLTIPELMPELKSLRDEHPSHDPEFPFVLSAGQRRSSNREYHHPRSAMAPEGSGGRALDESGRRFRNLEFKTAAACASQPSARAPRASSMLTDTMLPGHVALPNGTGLWYPDREGQEFQHGVAPNELTVTEDRDWFAGTPFHKHVPARIEAVA